MQSTILAADLPAAISMTDTDLEDMTVEQLAYWFWQERGSPEGSPEEDWFRAESELRSGRRGEAPRAYASSASSEAINAGRLTEHDDERLA